MTYVLSNSRLRPNFCNLKVDFCTERKISQKEWPQVSPFRAFTNINYLFVIRTQTYEVF